MSILQVFKDILMTREQIGRVLGYADPHRAIYKIHERKQGMVEIKNRLVRNLTSR